MEVPGPPRLRPPRSSRSNLNPPCYGSRLVLVLTENIKIPLLPVLAQTQVKAAGEKAAPGADPAHLAWPLRPGKLPTDGAAVERPMVLLVTRLGQGVTVEMARPASELGDCRCLCTTLPGGLGWSPLQFIPVSRAGGGAGGAHGSSVASPTSLCPQCLPVWSRMEKNMGNRKQF